MNGRVWRLARIALPHVAVCVLALAFAPVSAAKVVVDSAGFPGGEGGHLNTPAGVAVNQTGAGGVPPGTLYVGDVNEGNAAGKDANRIERLDAEGHFERLWGLDVVAGDLATGFQICTVATDCKRGVAVDPAPGGQVNAPRDIAVDQATGDVYVSDAGDNRIEKFDADGHFLRAWGWDVVRSGGAGDLGEDAFEICTVAADCEAGESSQSGGAANSPGALVLAPSGHVWVADGPNRRVEEFEPDGSFVAAYGWDVDALGGSGELEKCTSTAPGACQAATSGSALGQFGGTYAPRAMAFDSAGFLYAIDPGELLGSKRIERFDPTMTTVTLFAPSLFEETKISRPIESRILALPAGGFLLSGRVEGTGEDRLFELDESGQVTAESLEEDGLPNVGSLALNEASGAIYATVYNATNGGPGVAIIDDGPAQQPPALEIEPPTAIDGEGATFHGTVDPGGKLVANCRFQYSTDQVSWQDVPEKPDCRTLARAGGPQPVSATATGLEPATEYFVRLAAGRYYYALGDTALDPEPFTTPAESPIVSDVGAAQITDHSAFLAGEIKPRSQSFEYHFEYGTTPALGTPTPTVEATGGQARVVAQKVEGLESGKKYFLRLVAENECGGPPPEPCVTESEPIVTFRTRPTLPIPPCENQALREEQGSTFLSDCRAYEQVSPAEKNFVSIRGGTNGADGEAVLFTALGGFGEPPGQTSEISTAYRAKRTVSGWRTRWHNESYCVSNPDDTHIQPAIGGSPSGLSANLDFLAILRPESAACPYPPLDPAAQMPQTNLYRADYRGEPPDFALLAPEPSSEELFLKQHGGTYAGASEDWSRLFYTSTGWQQPSPPPGPPGGFAKVFEWQEGVPPKLVSVDPAGNPFTEGSMVPQDALHGVSADGKRVFFMTPTNQFGQCTPSGCEIYMRQNGTKTFDVSKSECTSACGESFADSFLAATPDGFKSLLMSKAKLSNEDTAGNGADLYLYTHGANPSAEQNLALLSKDEEPADGAGAQVLGLLGMSDDGETAYFVADGQLVAGAPTAAGSKLYRWQANGGSPTIVYLATLAPGSEDSGNWTGNGFNGARATVREVSADGEHVIIDSAARIDPGADHDSDRDVYRWSEADGWLCLSCQVPGVASAGDAGFKENDPYNHYSHAMSEDGGEVFFTTADPLVAADTNELRDVYEWREDGTLALISSGTDPRNVNFIGASASGRDVFFTTATRLVGWDTDDNADVYDARVGGGFPEPPPPSPICEDEASCRSASSREPSVPGAGSAVIEVPTKPKSRPCKKGKVRRHGKCVKARKHHHSKKHQRSQRQVAGADHGGGK